jgi:hypothetical protein
MKVAAIANIFRVHEARAVTSAPETELIIRSARIRRDGDQGDGVTLLLESQVNWSRLLEVSQRHGVTALVYHFFKNGYEDSIPDRVLNLLRGAYQSNAKSNLFLTGELFKLLKLFESHGIPAIPYKGPTLAMSVYGDIALRQFWDLDILVRKKDVLRVKGLLVARGCHPEIPLTGAQEEAYLNYHYDYTFFCNEGRVPVEIHWEIAETFFTFPLDTDRLWDRLVVVRLAGQQVPTLSPEDLLLILCAHGTKHLWERLGWICDIARLIDAHQELNWEQVFEHAASLGSERMLLLGVFLASDILGVRLPEEVSRRALADGSVKMLAAQVRKRLFREENDSPGIIRSAVFHLKARERARDRIKYLLRLALQTTVHDWLFIPIPRPLFFLYYLLRPVRLALKYASNLLKRFYD